MMTYLSCQEIYKHLIGVGITQTNESKYAYEFELSNGQVIYVKRLKDSRPSRKWVSRLMIHPNLEKYRSILQIDDSELNFNIKDNMSTAYRTFPVSPLS